MHVYRSCETVALNTIALIIKGGVRMKTKIRMGVHLRAAKAEVYSFWFCRTYRMWGTI